MIPTTSVVVGSLVIAAEAADGRAQHSIENNYTPWFVWGLWLTIVAIIAIAGFHLGRRFMADRRRGLNIVKLGHPRQPD